MPPVSQRPASQRPGWIDHLKASTSQHHKALEGVIFPDGGLETPEGIRKTLARFYGYYASHEKALIKAADNNQAIYDYLVALNWFDQRRRLPVLTNDLTILGVDNVDRLPCDHPSLVFKTVADAAAYLYMVEGSTMGGQMITKSIHQTHPALSGVEYFSPYGSQTMTYWQNFVKVTDTALIAYTGLNTNAFAKVAPLPHECEKTLGEIEAAADRAFSLLLDWFNDMPELEVDVCDWEKMSAIVSRNQLLEELIEKRTEELTRLNEELQSFSYSVSHDLRAPLRSIHGYCDALMEDCGEAIPEEGQLYLSRIQANVVKMGGLMDGLLKLCRLTHKPLLMEAQDITAMASSTVKMLKEQYPEHTVIATIEDNLTAYGDEELLGNLLYNLLSNAWKFTQSAEYPKVSVRLVERNDQQQWLLIEDNGVGFDQSYAKKIFSAFQRLHSDYDVEGHGIGLATAKRIVNQHQGHIEATSSPGEGASFYIYLPPKQNNDESLASQLDSSTQLVTS